MHAPSPPPPFSSSCATTSDDTICYHHLLWLWLLLFTALCTVIEVHLHVLLRALACSRRGSSASTGNCHLNWWHSHSGFFFSSSVYDFYTLSSPDLVLGFVYLWLVHYRLRDEWTNGLRGSQWVMMDKRKAQKWIWDESSGVSFWATDWILIIDSVWMGIHSVVKSCDVCAGVGLNIIGLNFTYQQYQIITQRWLISSSSHLLRLITQLPSAPHKRDFFRHFFFFCAGPQLLKGDFNKSKGSVGD